MGTPIENHLITIERVCSAQDAAQSREREVIATIPGVSGRFETGAGVLEVTVYEPDATGHQKVVFEGNSIPTVNQKRKRNHFTKHTGNRRVVDFPADPIKEIRQNMGQEDTLVFRRSPLKRQMLAAD